MLSPKENCGWDNRSEKQQTRKQPISIAIATNVEKGGKVDGVVEQVLGLLHHDIKEIWYIDEGEQEVKLVRHPVLD